MRLLGLDPAGAEARHSLFEATGAEAEAGGEPLEMEVLKDELDGLEDETFISCC